jgi:hypothetical protein
MTSSSTYSFSLTNGEAVISAFERLQIRLPSIRQEHMRTARNEMNFLFSDWANRGVNLWKIELIPITLVSGTATYSIPARVVMIVDAYLTLNNGLTNQTDRYITPISRTDYASFAAKNTAGPPTVYWFDRLISPTLTTWPVTDSSGPYVLNYYAWSQMQDAALTSGETPDVPYLWTDALVAGLAHRLARTYAPQLEAQRKADAQEAWTTAATQNIEGVPIRISPNLGRYYR